MEVESTAARRAAQAAPASPDAAELFPIPSSLSAAAPISASSQAIWDLPYAAFHKHRRGRRSRRAEATSGPSFGCTKEHSTERFTRPATQRWVEARCVMQSNTVQKCACVTTVPSPAHAGVAAVSTGALPAEDLLREKNPSARPILLPRVHPEDAPRSERIEEEEDDDEEDDDWGCGCCCWPPAAIPPDPEAPPMPPAAAAEEEEENGPPCP